jgi:hypothetical protein
MTSKLLFSDIAHTTILDPSEITQTKLKEGRIKAGSILKVMSQDQIIDILLIKEPVLMICGDTFEIDESEIKSRKRFLYSDIKPSWMSQKRLPVNIGFFKDLEENDTIVLILHRHKL